MKDGKPAVILKEFWQDPKHFADVFNAYFFYGKEVIAWEELQELDTDVSGTVQVEEQLRTLERTRDVIKKTAHGMEFVLLGIESQMQVHYAMPLRHMIYDGLGYLKECETFAAERHNKKTSAEFLSKMSAEDRLHPIFTLTIYYGEDPWDGPHTLKDMMVDMPEMMEERFSDYKMNLLQIRDSGDYTFHHGDVKLAFGITKELLEGNIKKIEEEYANEILTSSVRKFIGAVVSVPEFLETKKDEEEITMCRAMDAYRKEILEQGIERGIERGIEQSVYQLIKKGFNTIQICDLLELEEDYIHNVIAKIPQ